MNPMMNQKLKAALVTTFLAGAFVTSNGIAAASPSDYRAGMKDLVPQANAWVSDLEMTAAAALSKPELACGDQMAELARRGVSIAADLRGTGENAPRALVSANTQMTQSVERMAAAAAVACGDPAALADSVTDEKAGYNAAMLRINVFVQRSYASGR